MHTAQETTETHKSAFIIVVNSYPCYSLSIGCHCSMIS